MNISLSDAKSGEKYKVLKIASDENLKHKLLDFGIINGSIIKPLYNSMSKNSRSYEINNFVVGIRNRDAENVIVTDCIGGHYDK